MAAQYLLDSKILIAGLKGEPKSLLTRLAGLAAERFYISSVVLGEMLTGVVKSTNPVDRRASLDIITRGMNSLSYDEHDAEVYAAIRAALEKKGAPIGPHDLQIAAQAVARDLVLVTANLREFRRVPGLKCENWLR